MCCSESTGIDGETRQDTYVGCGASSVSLFAAHVYTYSFAHAPLDHVHVHCGVSVGRFDGFDLSL
jgi:hypothetical protein